MPTPRHASHAAIDPVETVTPPLIGPLFDASKEPAGTCAEPTGSCCILLFFIFYADSGFEGAWNREKPAPVAVIPVVLANPIAVLQLV